YGDAGAILAQDPRDLEAWASIRWHGTDGARKNSVCVGFNGRMDTFQAAVLLEKLALFDDELAARRRIGEAYNARLSSVAKPQSHIAGGKSGYGYYALRTGNRDGVAALLKEAGVPTAIYYATPLHRMEAFAPYISGAPLTETERLADEVLSLPMHPYLTPDQVDYICEMTIQAIQSAA
ncbi:MAG: DegT/DnrJ/EryC1/StrS family aminotransferase, partial [Amphiplicatus sp.]